MILKLTFLMAALGASCLALPPEPGQSTEPLQFKAITKVDSLPKPVRQLLVPDGVLVSNPSGPFNEGCVGNGNPWQRMIFAGQSSNVVIIGYEVGGRAYCRHLKAYRFDLPKPLCILDETLPRKCSTLESVLPMVRSLLNNKL